MEGGSSPDCVKDTITGTPPLLPTRRQTAITSSNFFNGPRRLAKPADCNLLGRNDLALSFHGNTTEVGSVLQQPEISSTSISSELRLPPSLIASVPASSLTAEARPSSTQISNSVHHGSPACSSTPSDDCVKVKICQNDFDVRGCSKIACNINNNNCHHDETSRQGSRRAADNIYVASPSSQTPSTSSSSWIQNLGVDHLRPVSSSYSASTSALSLKYPVSPVAKPSTLPKNSKLSVTPFCARGGQQQASFELENAWNASAARQRCDIEDDNRHGSFKRIDVSDDEDRCIGLFISSQSSTTMASWHGGTSSTLSTDKRAQCTPFNSSSRVTTDNDISATDRLVCRHGVACSRCGRCCCDRCQCCVSSDRRRHQRPLPSVWCGPRCGLWTVARTIECVSCVCLVQAVDYHCSSTTPEDIACRRNDTCQVFAVGNIDIESGKKFDDDCDDSFDAMESPCSCVRSTSAERSSCCRRWACLVGLAAVGCLPCLLLYWPLRAVAEVFRKLCCGVCNKLWRRRPGGCRCRPPSVVVIVDGSR